MGKPVDVELGGAAGLEIAGGGGGGGGGVWAVAGAIGRAASFRCVFVLALSVGVLVSALLLLVPTRGHGFLSDDPVVLGGELFPVKFCFRWCEGMGIRGFRSSEVVDR